MRGLDSPNIKGVCEFSFLNYIGSSHRQSYGSLLLLDHTRHRRSEYLPKPDGIYRKKVVII